jgi:hypothetical protein
MKQEGFVSASGSTGSVLVWISLRNLCVLVSQWLIFAEGTAPQRHRGCTEEEVQIRTLTTSDFQTAP